MNELDMGAQSNIGDKNLEQQEKYQQSSQKRRGRPEKKPEPFFEQGEELFTIHDNVFHVAVLFYTYRIFDKAPTRKKFNPTIGFSVYEKIKSFDRDLKKYYDRDQIAEASAQTFQDNFHIVQFFKNSMTFGPKCVVDQFFQLFHFILSRLRDNQPISVEMCIQYMQDFRFRYINFENEVLDFLEAKTIIIRDGLREIIKTQLYKLLEILIHTLTCINANIKENMFVTILESDQEMFERGIHSKTKKKIKNE